MLTRDVCYDREPKMVEVERIGVGYQCRVDLPVNVRENVGPDGERQYTADVYSVQSMWTPGMEERVAAQYDTWMAIASAPAEPLPTLDDVIEAVNELTELVLMGMEG